MKSLNIFMKKNKLSSAAFATILGVHYRCVYNWKRGASRPRVDMAIKIEAATNGEVSVYDWR